MHVHTIEKVAPSSEALLGISKRVLALTTCFSQPAGLMYSSKRLARCWDLLSTIRYLAASPEGLAPQRLMP
jgi:hypothetical protein